jgi:hypothetical protein
MMSLTFKTSSTLLILSVEISPIGKYPSTSSTPTIAPFSSVLKTVALISSPFLSLRSAQGLY